MAWRRLKATTWSIVDRQHQPVCRAFLLSLLAHILLLVTIYPILPIRPRVDGNPLQATIVFRKTEGVTKGKEKLATTTLYQPDRSPNARRQRLAVSDAVDNAPANRHRQKNTPPSLDSTSRPAAMPRVTEVTKSLSVSPEEHTTHTVDPEDLRHYRIALAFQARRSNSYPVAARQQGWHGRVEVTSTFSSHLLTAQSFVSRSSGYQVLDEQALRMIEQASAVTPLPESLRGRDFRLIIPIEFSLDDSH
ncbi:MAG: TonB family protein [Candidatus Accumulibacter sp.]|nr:TonB family protein [Accumulibacter sp.]